jgi:D-lyxose ketol-isomerase
VQVDGVTRIIPFGDKLILEPGESVTLPPKLCHQFCGHKGDKKVLAGEISSLNDDTKDNCFLGKKVDRSTIIEDEAAKYSLTGEYAIGAPRT